MLRTLRESSTQNVTQNLGTSTHSAEKVRDVLGLIDGCTLLKLVMRKYLEGQAPYDEFRQAPQPTPF